MFPPKKPKMFAAGGERGGEEVHSPPPPAPALFCGWRGKIKFYFWTKLTRSARDNKSRAIFFVGLGVSL